MSVWPNIPQTNSSSLGGREGELVSISVTVAPLNLEDLLETLAALDFPINPQIYHDAAVVYVDDSGNERSEPATIVEFPAYAGGLGKIRGVLDLSGFNAAAISVSPMLDEIRSGEHKEPAPPGADYAYRILRKRPASMASRIH